MAREAAGEGEERLSLRVPEVARLTGMSRSTTYMAIRRGQLPHIKVGGRYIVPRDALEKWLQESVRGGKVR